MNREKRKFKRIKTRFPVTLKIGNSEVIATLIDVTEEGMQIEIGDQNTVIPDINSELPITLLSPLIDQNKSTKRLTYKVLRCNRTAFGKTRIGLNLKKSPGIQDKDFAIINPENYALYGSLEQNFSRLAEQLSVALPNQGSKTILLTLPELRQGFAVLPWWLATTLSLIPGTKVLFVDADFRKSIADMDEQDRGLLDIIYSDSPIDDCVVTVIPNSLDVLNAGGQSLSVRGEPKESAVKSALLALKDQYQYVVINALPVDESPLVLLLAKYSDGVFLVLDSGISLIDKSKETLGQLEAIGARILGVLLNKFVK